MTAADTAPARRPRASDPDEQRRRRREDARAYYAAHKTEINARRRQKWAQDEERRQRMLAQHRAYHAEHRAEINARQRRKWATDADFRRRTMARAREKKAERRLRTIYGMSSADYAALLERQNGACAICKRKIERTLCVDHCHASGAVRGLLCQKCNHGLGCYDDDSGRMQRAIAYLARPPDRTD